MNPLETYLKEFGEIRATGAAVAETSYYPALSNLLNEIGKTLKPKVRCVINLANRGAGLPDGGLFTPDQIKKDDPNPMTGQMPARGAIEAKPPALDVRNLPAKEAEQVKGYVSRYGLVLITNFRDFLLRGNDANGNPLPLEGFTLADSDAAFRELTRHPQKAAKEHGEQFYEYLKRVMLYKAPIAAPQDLAWFLASYARDAKARVENHKDLSALNTVRAALEEALGMKFTGEKGDHFFRSTLVQTLFYGVFSAWVLWHRENPAGTDIFNWKQAEWSLRVPFIRTLYEQVATSSKLGPLNLVEVLDWTEAALNRVRREDFFAKFQDEHAVQYFYEPFLEAFDPELRKELGVWYTPPEIVKYQVARIHKVLQDELGKTDGLADETVVVLDPCCGTGAYLVEVLRCIHERLKETRSDDLIASDLKKAAMTRIFGFEILPAPFVVSHLQLGLILHDLGAPLSAKGNERVGVYLTNSLTGWEPPKEPKTRVMGFMPELQEEKDAAEKVKQTERVLVVLGNPPYNAFAGVSPEEEQGLVEPYKGLYYAEKKLKKGRTKQVARYLLNDPVSDGGWGIKKFNLDDMYVRFFRLAERRIAEMTGKGVVSFISNFSYLGDPSFVVMRERFLSEFDKLWFDCMNGDSRETGKLTPEGAPDPSVFSTEQNREGIRVGTAISVMVRKDRAAQPPSAVSQVRFRHFWGVTKREDVLTTVKKEGEEFDAAYTAAKPCKENRYSFRPENVSAAYNAWPKLPDLCEVAPSNGLMEKRGGALIDIDKDALETRMKDYFNRDLSWEDYKARQTALVQAQAAFDPPQARRKALAAEGFDPKRLLRYTIRPFETRWCYYTVVRPIWNSARPALWKQCFEGNTFLLSRMRPGKAPEGAPMYFCRGLSDDHLLSPDAVCFAMRLASAESKAKELAVHDADLRAKSAKPGKKAKQSAMYSAQYKANLSTATRAYLAELKIEAPDASAETAGMIWMHALAVGYSPAYLAENADGIRRDWPRIPLPDSRKALEKSAEFGREVAALLDTERKTSDLMEGKFETIFKEFGPLKKVGDGELDLAVTAGWGHAGKGGGTMPGKGRIVERPYSKEELAAITDAAKSHGSTQKAALALLGADTRDVYLNDKACWRNVPANVWEYYIGGYQVIKKWLSYREQELLKRPLKSEEAREVTAMVRRIAALILMQPALDENYRQVTKKTYTWLKQ